MGKKILLVLLALGAISTAACSQTAEKIIRNIQVTATTDKDQNTAIQLRGELGSSSLSFGDVTLPIGNKGSMKVEKGSDGKNYFLLGLNATALRGDKALADTNLPNGKTIPLTGVSDLKAYSAGAHSRLYLGTVNGKMVIGVAMVIDKFDQVAKYVPSANVFLPFKDTKINGTAGFFTSKLAGQSGMAFFLQTDVAMAADQAMASAQGVSVGKVVSVLKWVLSIAAPAQLQWLTYFLDYWSSIKELLKLK